MPDSVRYKAKLIVYVDSAECTTCRISRLGRYKETKSLLEKESLALLVLLENTVFATIPLAKYLQDMDLEIPVYVDEEGLFLILNDIEPKEGRLHSLFVDRVGHPLLVGDPSSSNEMLELFKNVINTNKPF